MWTEMDQSKKRKWQNENSKFEVWPSSRSDESALCTLEFRVIYLRITEKEQIWWFEKIIKKGCSKVFFAQTVCGFTGLKH